MMRFLKKRWWLITILFIMAAAAMAYKEYTRKAADLSNKAPDVVVSADQMVADYKANEEEANKKYLGKTIDVWGSLTAGDTPYSLWLGSDTDTKVSCTLDSLHATTTAIPAVGKPCRVRGICTGFLMDVEMAHCVIIK